MQELQKQLELLTQQKLKKLESLRAIQSEKKTLLDLAEKKIKKENQNGTPVGKPTGRDNYNNVILTAPSKASKSWVTLNYLTTIQNRKEG